MASFSQYLADQIINHTLRNVAYTSPTDVWIALFTADNGLENGTITGEVSGGSYARLQIDGTTLSFVDPAGTDTTSNAQDWNFPQASANWGTVTHCAVMDASTAGNVLYHKSLTTPRTVNTNDTARFLTGEFDLQLL